MFAQWMDLPAARPGIPGWLFLSSSDFLRHELQSGLQIFVLPGQRCLPFFVFLLPSCGPQMGVMRMKRNGSESHRQDRHTGFLDKTTRRAQVQQQSGL